MGWAKEIEVAKYKLTLFKIKIPSCIDQNTLHKILFTIYVYKKFPYYENISYFHLSTSGDSTYLILTKAFCYTRKHIHDCCSRQFTK